MTEEDIVVTQEDLRRIGAYLDFMPGWADDSTQAYTCRRIALEAAAFANGISPRNRRKNYENRVQYIVHGMVSPHP